MKRKIPLLLIALLAAAFLLRAIFFFQYKQVWWDGAVYLGMGKYIFSSGTAGIWEPIRPLVLPFILGLGWKLGLNQVIFGKILIVTISLCIILMTYLVARRFATERAALIAAAITAFFPVFFLFSFRIYTEMPSVLFALMALYWFRKDTLLFSGLLAALATMTRFHE
ncbi:MAG: glycosyltransferase family 39 protein, partial [Candidatus Woesearchaeota archaeon]